MFQFLVSAYRRLQAAIHREAAAIEDTASLREQLNVELRAAMEDRVRPDLAATLAHQLEAESEADADLAASHEPVNRIDTTKRSGNGRKHASAK